MYVTVRVEEHPLFRREGDDLHLVVPVAVHEAVLGARVEIPVLDGTRAAARAAGDADRTAHPPARPRGAIAPRRATRRPGGRDSRRRLPRVLDERSKELLRQFGEINGRENVREQFERFLERE